MSNTMQVISEDDEDSWVVRAFAEDTGNIMGTTWPPRSYTCTYCRREFRSAQALGGHMNVHRRDRARYHQEPPPLLGSSPSSVSTPTFMIPTQEFTTNGGGLCVLYQIPNPSGVFTPATMNACPNFDLSPPSSPLSTSPYPLNSPMGPSINDIQVEMPQGLNFCQIYSGKSPSPSSPENSTDVNNNNCEVAVAEELDLELRLGLGHRPTPPT